MWLIFGMNLLGLYQFGHDTAHGSLFTSEKLSRFIGQLVFLPCLHPYSKWIYGHNKIHHSNTVMLKGDLAWHPKTPEKYNRMSFYEKCMHRFYWSAFGSGFYYIVKMWWQGLILFEIDKWPAKRDRMIVLAFGIISSASIVYLNSSGSNWSPGLWAFIKIQLVPFIIVNYFIGSTVYVQHTLEESV